MRIAFIVGRFPALSQTFILRQITGLLDRGHDVEIFAQSSGNEPINHGDIEKYGLLERTCYLDADASPPNVIVLIAKRVGLLVANFHKHPRAIVKTFNALRFGKSALSLGVLRAVAPFLDKRPYDIVHCQFGPLGSLGLLLKDTGILHGRLVTSFRGYDVSSFIKRTGEHVYQDLFSRGDLFLCVSERIRDKVIQLGCEPRKVVVHRSGAEVKKADLPVNGAKGIGKTRITTIGRLIEKKGVEYGIQAVARILARRRDIEYCIAGEGPLRGRLQSLIDGSNAAGHIRLLGWKTQAEIADLLNASDILLAPSVTTHNGDEEGIPGVIMEAFAHEVPVVGTCHAGIPEVVKNGESGLLVAERDVDALTQALEQMINHAQLRVAMGRSGCHFVQEHYDVDKLNDRLVQIYQQLLHGELPSVYAQLHVPPESLSTTVVYSKATDFSRSPL